MRPVDTKHKKVALKIIKLESIKLFNDYPVTLMCLLLFLNMFCHLDGQEAIPLLYKH